MLPPLLAAAAPQAAQLGVPRGPLWGRLAKGETVTSANGREVTSAEVMQPSTPGGRCAALRFAGKDDVV